MNNIPAWYSEITFSKVLTYLGECEGQCGNLSWRDALVRLKNNIGIKKPKNSFEIMFGQYGIASKDYWLLDKNELETARKYLKKICGCKLFVRIMPDVRFAQKEFHAFTEPGVVLWEISGTDIEVVKSAACELQKLIGIPLEVFGK